MPENGCCVTIVMQHGETSEPAGRTSLLSGKHETTGQLLDKSSGLQQLILDERFGFYQDMYEITSLKATHPC